MPKIQNQKPNKEATYNWKWHWFIEGLVSGKDQYIAYGEAYGYDANTIETTKKTLYVSASELLRNPKFQEAYGEYLQAHGFNDAEVDKGLLSLIKSDNPKVQLPAMEMYNKLRARYVSKVDHTTNGKDLPTPIMGAINVSTDNSISKDS